MDAVRRALETLGRRAMPKEIQDHIREKYGVQMEPAMISNYKSSLKSNRSKLHRRAPSRARAAADPSTGTFSTKDIAAVKLVVDKIGAHKVQQLAQVLGK
jgi:hypothetical protein